MGKLNTPKEQLSWEKAAVPKSTLARACRINTFIMKEWVSSKIIITSSVA